MTKLILASTSPRRVDILRLGHFIFEQQDSEYEEDMSEVIAPEDLVKKLALGKALSVAQREKKAVVLGADTIIVLGKTVLGKPHTEKRAREMLHLLSNKTHRVLTGHAIVDADSGKRSTAFAESFISFRKLSTEEIDAYIATGEPLDRAGAYAMQGGGGAFIKRIEGDYFGVLGLSLVITSALLKKFGIEPQYRQ